jgi:hypothetical protein
MSDAAMWIGIGVTGVLSIVALYNSRKAHREAIALQKRLVEIEQQRETDRLRQAKAAKLRADLRPTPQGCDRLYIFNSGDCEARNVTAVMDGKPITEHPASPRGEEFPELIGPDSEVSYLLAWSRKTNPPYELEITWDDDSGNQRLYRTTLTSP